MRSQRGRVDTGERPREGRAEIGGWWPQAKEHQEPPEAGRGREDPQPEPSGVGGARPCWPPRSSDLGSASKAAGELSLSAPVPNQQAQQRQETDRLTPSSPTPAPAAAFTEF